MGKAEDLAGFDLLNKTFTSISHFEQEFWFQCSLYFREFFKSW
jgi:hypothetical protein